MKRCPLTGNRCERADCADGCADLDKYEEGAWYALQYDDLWYSARWVGDRFKTESGYIAVFRYLYPFQCNEIRRLS